MATPNYQFEKRRRELEKKAKKEEKRRHKLETSKHPLPEASEAAPAPAGEDAVANDGPTDGPTA